MEVLLERNTAFKNKYEREILINKYIEKFPKVKLDAIININKYYNNNDLDKKKDINKIIFEYVNSYE
jgi:hypothetical protein